MEHIPGIWVGAALIAAIILILIISSIIKRSKRNPVKLQLHRTDKDFIVSDNDTDDDIVGPVRVKSIDESAAEDAIIKVPPQAPEPKVANPNLPRVVSIFVKAKPREQFYGYDLMQAILNQGFTHGAQHFFHYSDGHRTLFSLASMEAPGTFNLDKMGAFKTTGVCLFFQPPRFNNPEAIFDQMYALANDIASELGGVVEDEHHHLMTPERLNDWRSKLA